MDDYNVLRDFCTPLFAYLLLLGMYLLVLGFGLGCLACAAYRARKNREANADRPPAKV